MMVSSDFPCCSRRTAAPPGRTNLEPVGGRGGIRTHGTLAGTPVFKTGALNHSSTLPLQRYQPLSGRKIKNGLDQTGAGRLFGHVIRPVFASCLEKSGRKGGEGVADVLVGLLGGFSLHVNSLHE